MADEKETKEFEESMKPERDLPEAPLSTHIDAYYKGFHVGMTIRSTDNTKIPIGNVKKAIERLVELGFEPSWNRVTSREHLNGETPKEEPDADWIKDEPIPPKAPPATTPPVPVTATAPLCPIHNVAMNYRPAGVSRAGKPYNGFWACPMKNPDNTWCSYKPEMGVKRGA